MSKEAVFTLKLEYELRDDFMAAAAASHRPASQLVREFMRDFIQRQRQSREYDAWFKHEVQAGLDDNSPMIAHEKVMDDLNARLKKRISKGQKSED